MAAGSSPRSASPAVPTIGAPDARPSPRDGPPARRPDLRVGAAGRRGHRGPTLRATSPSGRPLAADAFRDGERWLARLWLDEPGQWRWERAGPGAVGAVERPSVASAWPRGALRASADRRYFEQADGAAVLLPRRHGLVHRLQGHRPTQWRRYLDRRAEHGYAVVQMHLLPFAWAVPDPDGNHPFVDDDVARPSPAYFARVDRLCAMAAERGLYTCMCLMWGGNRPGMPAGHFTTEQAVAFARYAVARYAAFPMIWSLSGDAPYVEDLDKWEAVGAAVEAADPYRHPTTNHLPPSMNWRFLHHDSPWHDFHMLQTGHRRQAGRLDIAALPAAYRAREPAKPVVNGEPWYEAHPEMDDYRATGRYGRAVHGRGRALRLLGLGPLRRDDGPRLRRAGPLELEAPRRRRGAPGRPADRADLGGGARPPRRRPVRPRRARPARAALVAAAALPRAGRARPARARPALAPGLRGRAGRGLADLPAARAGPGHAQGARPRTVAGPLGRPAHRPGAGDRPGRAGARPGLARRRRRRRPRTGCCCSFAEPAR